MCLEQVLVGAYQIQNSQNNIYWGPYYFVDFRLPKVYLNLSSLFC